ncbi:hypothetical protein HOK021_34990 [Streptomyces hygroscopicus]|nr:hypothetical protein HOK021_34990 [Streptomyces hygroscopicus]
MLYRIRTGVQWRDLAERYGPWKTVHERHRRWSADGAWELMLQRIQADADAVGGTWGERSGAVGAGECPVTCELPLAARPMQRGPDTGRTAWMAERDVGYEHRVRLQDHMSEQSVHPQSDTLCPAGGFAPTAVCARVSASHTY